MSSQMHIANKVLGAKIFTSNEVANIKGGNGLNFVKLKTGRSKSRQLSKFKKLSKSGNLPKFVTRKVGPSFLTPDTRTAFNCLQLVFTKVPIFQHFDS